MIARQWFERFVDRSSCEDARLLLEFYVVFSRFEYALKKAGYVASGNRAAQIDWRRFANAPGHADRFEERAADDHFVKAVSYLLEYPPRLRRKRGGELDWEDRSNNPLGSTNLGRAVQALKDTRNNLFHGDKDPLFPDGQGRRDRELLRHGVLVLYTLVELDDKVRLAFTGG